LRPYRNELASIVSVKMLPVLPLLTVFAVILPCTLLAIASSFSYNNIAHAQDAANATTLTLNTITNVPWGKDVTVTGKLTIDDASDAGVEGKTITFDGTGADNIPNAVTNADGTFTAKGAAPNSVNTGWKVQAHFEGDTEFEASDSAIKTYSTTKHGTNFLLTAAKPSFPWSTATSFTATLIDTSLGGTPIEGKTVHFDGTGVIGVSDQTTDSSGKAIGTGTAPDTVNTGWSYQAHFAGDSLYVKKDSVVKTYSTTKHTVSLVVSAPSSVPWSMPTKFTATLKDTSLGGVAISGKTIHFDGTGVIPAASDQTTDSSGKAIATGTAPDTVASGWTYQAHFAGDSLYSAKDSSVKSYSTTKHSVSLSLSVPTDAVSGGASYKVSGTLTDSTAKKPLASRTITFTADDPITIGDKTTNTNGFYSGTQTAPSTAGSYDIQSHFAGDNLYNAKDSVIKTLTVTAAPPQGSLPSAESVFNTETFTVPHHVSHFILINPTHSHHGTSSSWISSTNGLYLPTDLVISQNTAVTLLVWDNHGIHQLQAKRADNGATEWTTSALADKQYSSPAHIFSAATKYNTQDIYDAPGYIYDQSHIKGTITTQSSTVTPDGTVVGAMYVPQSFDRSMITSKGLTIESEYNFHKVWKHLPYDNTLIIYSSKQSLTNTLADIQTLIDEIAYD
jgi:hypothetical protein